ncbi:MAG: hypothetical protein L0332_12615 [Chloroflexi bacterium]|nr:hypothetical protein [Chloroflexota bacterium]MCI0644230.1 hypothetical protein [Chloroflexota bacterium]MCI0727549.1 hypothetical protein [Chloroflexota bacterium]
MLNKRDHLILDTLLPAGAHPGLPLGLAGAGFDAFWSEFERTALPSWRRGFRAALWLATWIAPLLIRRPPPLTLYNRPARERALAAMERSRLYLLRQMIGLLKTTVSLGYGAAGDVRQAIGYPLQHDDPRRPVAS